MGQHYQRWRCARARGLLIMECLMIDRPTWPWPRREPGSVAGRRGRYTLPSAARFGIAWSVLRTAGLIWVAASYYRLARLCWAWVRPITRHGWCGPGAMDWTPRQRACIGISNQKRRMTIE